MKFQSGDYVTGRAQINKKVMLKGVVIREYNNWSVLVAYFDERRRPQYRILFHPQKIEGEPPEALLKKAKENPNWGLNPDERIIQRTNI
ncbi:MAG TPA: hypothetical protein P5293_00395 [Bacteroidales bacterium]|nr:hypothetical protein [Bacteroidales bacterium]